LIYLLRSGQPPEDVEPMTLTSCRQRQGRLNETAAVSSVVIVERMLSLIRWSSHVHEIWRGQRSRSHVQISSETDCQFQMAIPKMWQTTKNLLHCNPSCTLNDDQCRTMSSTLCTFFVDKANRFHASIMTVVQSMNIGTFQTRQLNGQPTDSFSDIEPSDVLKLTNKLPNKSSPRDALRTSLLKM